MKIKSRHQQQGAETLEFTIIAIFYFALLFGVFEFARALYTWNMLTEATRRGARMAVVCPYQSPIPANVAVFSAYNVSGTPSSPIISGLDPTSDVTIRYLNDTGVVVVADPVTGEVPLFDIDFVQVTITHTHQMLFSNLFSYFIPTWSGSLISPTFQTTIPVESLGADPTFALPALPTTCNY